jgi:type IV secretory pathway VirB10-like protein
MLRDEHVELATAAPHRIVSTSVSSFLISGKLARAIEERQFQAHVTMSRSSSIFTSTSNITPSLDLRQSYRSSVRVKQTSFHKTKPPQHR